MPKVRSSYIHALLILFVFASLPVAALAQDHSSAPGFQLASPVAALAQNDSSAPRFQLASPIAFLGQPDGIPVLDSGSGPVPAFDGAQTTQATPPPPQVHKVTRQMRYEARHWHIGGRIGAGFSPELFMFGLQSQIGPVFSPRLLLRPNADFSFGELTDMFALNLEGAYFLRTVVYGRWTPYFGMGPALNFIHQGTTTSDVSFSDFTYKTGFNVFVGGQKGKTFVEIKTSLWSGPAPVLRLILGYNF